MAGSYRGCVIHIDTDAERQEEYKECFEEFGILVHTTPSIEGVSNYIIDQPVSVVVLPFELMVGQVAGVCNKVRLYFECCRVIVLLKKYSPHIECLLFECGADDVVCIEQRSPATVACRIIAHLRNIADSKSVKGKVSIGDVVVNLERSEVYRNGECHTLQGVLYDLLKYFIMNYDRVISREELAGSPIWRCSACTPANEGGKTFDVHIGKLRRILEHNPKKPEIIESVRGKGWKLGKTPSVVNNLHLSELHCDVIQV